MSTNSSAAKSVQISEIPLYISEISEEHGIYRFTLKGIDVSIANSIRRTIINDIPTLVFEPAKTQIEVNTGRLHNEILKHRLACIPIHMKDHETLIDKYRLVVDQKNETEDIVYVTTEHFTIQNKENNNFLTKEEQHRIFPPNQRTHYYIDFSRLRAKLGDLPGEHLRFTADFSVKTAKDDAAYNVVSKCSYANSPDHTKITELKDELEARLKSEEVSNTDIEFHVKNFMLLDSKRHFIPHSFDFVIKTIGVYDNKELVKKACVVLQNKCIQLIDAIDSDTVSISPSEVAFDHAYDVKLENEDYTLGTVLEYILYEKYFQGEKTMTFCGFKKFHPHDTHSVIRVAYADKVDKHVVKQNLRLACIEAQDVYRNIYKLF
jgi:DNA-directed RNA polymerase alpha subunit